MVKRLALLLQRFSSLRLCWILLLIVGLLLEFCGLYFQYSLGYPPCVYCVEERAFIACFVIIGLAGMLLAGFKTVRLLLGMLLTASSVLGLRSVIAHLAASHNSSPFGGSCRLVPDFHAYLPLDEWLPWLFMPRGSCDPLPWSLLGLDMPSWILIIFLCSLTAGILLTLAQLVREPHEDFLRLYR